MNQPGPDDELLGSGDFLALYRVDGWEYVKRRNITGIAIVVASTAAGEVVLVEQFRPSLQRRVVELPAGVVGDLPGREQEDLLAAAGRELLEETGFEASALHAVVHGPVAAGISRDYYTFVRATGLRQVHEGGGDETEDIAVHVVALPAVHSFLASRSRQGALIDPKVLVGLYLLRHEDEWQPLPEGI